MADFKVGDRIQITSTDDADFDTGIVLSVSPGPAYQVQVDPDGDGDEDDEDAPMVCWQVGNNLTALASSGVRSSRRVLESRLAGRPAGAFYVRSFDFESDSSDGRTLEGYAAVFNSPTRIRDHVGEFDEVILPGAFARSLDRRTPVLQFDHGKDPRVGAVPIGKIEALSEDTQGLHVRARLFDNAVVEPVRQAIAEQAIRGMSFRFQVPDGGDAWSTRSGTDYREINDADTYELGPVVFPAYDATTVNVRSLLAQLDPDEHRLLLRELAAEMRALTDPTGASVARSTDRGARPTRATAVTHPRQRLDDGALKLRGIIR